MVPLPVGSSTRVICGRISDWLFVARLGQVVHHDGRPGQQGHHPQTVRLALRHDRQAPELGAFLQGGSQLHGNLQREGEYPSQRLNRPTSQCGTPAPGAACMPAWCQCHPTRLSRPASRFQVHDLLDPKANKQSLKVREHNVLGPYVDGLSQLAVTDFQVGDSVEAGRDRQGPAVWISRFGVLTAALCPDRTLTT